nr:hypothetical protein BHI3_18150 [Bacteriovorax sp. HI3]
MKPLLLSLLLISFNLQAQEPNLKISDDSGAVVTLAKGESMSNLLLYSENSVESCFSGNADELINEINGRLFEDSDWGLSDGKVLDQNHIGFMFWDLGGILNSFIVERCL